MSDSSSASGSRQDISDSSSASGSRQNISEGADQPFDPAAIRRKPETGFETFAALDLRVGRVLAVEPFPEARTPAWKLEVDFGPAVGVLQTSAQITNYERDELVGRRVIGAINLGTKRIAGFDSEFLVLGAMDPDGTVRLLRPDGEPPRGAPVA